MVLEIVRQSNKVTLIETLKIQETETGLSCLTAFNSTETFSFIDGSVKEAIVYANDSKWYFDKAYIQHIKETYEKRSTMEAR